MTKQYFLLVPDNRSAAAHLRESLEVKKLRKEASLLKQTIEKRSSYILDLKEELAQKNHELEETQQRYNQERNRAVELEGTIRRMEMERAPVVATGSLSDYAAGLGLSPKRRSRSKKK